jgi:hypothetical protein
MNEDDKMKLTGRIYPAIQSCVANRYKIMAGYFAVVGFLVAKPKALRHFIDSHALFFLSSIFTFFVFHNFCNYWINAQEQQNIEQSENSFPKMEVLFALIRLAIVWVNYCLLINHEPA